MKLNLGCGYKRLPGFLNVDSNSECEPDELWDLEKTPWPWPDNSCEAVVLDHVMEHLGADTKTFMGIIKELYRICKDDCPIEITVPHPRHDIFIIDPTHVRPILPEGLALFSQKINKEHKREGRPDSTLGLALGVDFEIENVTLVPDGYWQQRRQQDPSFTMERLEEARRNFNNVVIEIQILWRVRKPL